MAAKKSFGPQGLRALLATLLVIVILGGAGLFYVGLNTVKDFSSEVNNTLQDADASSKQVTELQSLKGQLSQTETLTAKADAVFATPATYQSQALTDVKRYAAQTGLRIDSTNFDNPAATGTYSMNIQLKSPVAYSQLMQFIGLIEGNLPKMQLTSIDLQHSPGGNADSVVVGSIKLNVAVR